MIPMRNLQNTLENDQSEEKLRKPSKSKYKVFRVLLHSAENDEWVHGYEISKTQNLHHSTVYKILNELIESEKDLIEQNWEIDEESKKAKHLVRLTEDGGTYVRRHIDFYLAKEAEKYQNERKRLRRREGILSRSK